MHPFSLNEEQVNQVSGGKLPPPIYSTMALGEEGAIPPEYLTGKGWETTMAIGEEGGTPVDPT